MYNIRFDLSTKFNKISELCILLGVIKEISRYILEVAFQTPTSCNITDNTVAIELEQTIHESVLSQ